MLSFTHFGIKMIQLLIILSLAVIFSKRHKKGYQGFIFILLMLGSALLQSLIETIAFFARTYFQPIDKYTMPFEYFFYSLTFLFLIMHFEYYLDFHFIPTALSILMITIIFTTCAIDFKYDLGFFSFQPIFHLGIGRLWLFLFDLFQLVAITFCFVASIIIIFSARGTRALVKTIVIGVAMFIAVIGAILEFLEHFIPNFDPYGALPFGIGFFIIFLLYLFYPDFVFYSPEPIYQFIVIHKNGQVIYDYYHPREEITNKVLIGSVFHAFVMYIEELTKSEQQILKYIQLSDRAIILCNKKDILGIIISNRYRLLFKHSVRMFIERFYKEFQEEIKTFTGDTSVFEKADDLVRKTFSYAVINDD